MSGAITCSMVVEIKPPSCPIKIFCVELALGAASPRGKIIFDSRGIDL